MDYQTVANKVKDFITLKAEIQQKLEEINRLETTPPQLEKDVLTWEEAVAFAENKKSHADTLNKLRMGIMNRQEIVLNREKEIGEILPIQNHYILFKINLNETEETYKIGYFPDSYGFRMEKMIPDNNQ
ncbi:MAG: hypothetical protein EAZ44_08410 [Cytophagia bacterium]|nr:MAG: hypothetical protein EAY69_06000 [Cytophagales bacterium]TAG01471.1 MAG: hypothetical protein EAZ44_08410 [Cytophagia bacterium]TAG39173.1 MAG: hypothetical protein EAZ31_09605 [Cytophagia bacterium]TAG59108.1 MAG: hypothetical protein EAZ27_01040 [Cytophagales bacterium]